MPHEVEAEELSAHYDGALSPERSAAVASHLKACVDCRRELERLGQASARFQTHGSRKAPEALRAKLQGAAAGAVRKRTTSGEYVLWLSLGVIAILLAGKTFKPQVSSVFNQVMGMVSGAAQGVDSPK